MVLRLKKKKGRQIAKEKQKVIQLKTASEFRCTWRSGFTGLIL